MLAPAGGQGQRYVASHPAVPDGCIQEPAFFVLMTAPAQSFVAVIHAQINFPWLLHLPALELVFDFAVP